jgi:uncharacterized protein YlxW (UPF0749 family)
MNIKNELVKTLRNLVSAYFGKVYTASELKVSDKVVGGVVEMIAADGTLSTAPDGEYIMEDGFHFMVKGGVIETILDKDGNPIVEVEEEELSDYTPSEQPIMTGETVSTEMDIVEDVTSIESSLFELYNRVMEMEGKVTELQNQLAEMTTQKMESEKAIETFNKVVNELNNNIKTLASVPVQFSKTDNSAKENEEKQNRLNELVSILNLNKKK